VVPRNAGPSDRRTAQLKQVTPKAFASAKAFASLIGWFTLTGGLLPGISIKTPANRIALVFLFRRQKKATCQFKVPLSA